MNYANPHFFSAILDGIPHRFVLVMESESLKSHTGFSPPRFTVGGVNGTKDPRLTSLKHLMEVGVNRTPIKIPPTWVSVHQFIYIIGENTDENGWQYRHQWSSNAVPSPKEEPWTNKPQANSKVRRRVWMSTIVPRQDLVRAKRYISENFRVDVLNNVIKQGELLRYEKGTLTKSWHRRRVVLYNNRLEFYSGNNKKGEILLVDVEVKMLFENQCPGKKYAFSIRNAIGSIGVLLDAEDEESRREWVFAIQYRLAVTTHEMNFSPLEYGPPTGPYPDNRVLISGDLMLQGRDGTWIPRHFQLLPREMVYYQDITLKGRIFIEQATIMSDDRLLTFTITSQSGITFNLIAGNAEAKNVWLNGISRQILAIENQKLKVKTIPKEEQIDESISPLERVALFREESKWKVPPVEGEDYEYLHTLFLINSQNHPFHSEYSEELGISSSDPVDVNPNRGLSSGKRSSILNEELAAANSKSMLNVDIAGADAANNNGLVASSGSAESPVSSPTAAMEKQQSSRITSLLSTKSFLFSTESKLLDPKRTLINPRFMLASLKGVTHRFVLVLESEMRTGATREIQVLAPPRFTVGGPRASKDPRSVNLNQLIGVTHKMPEIQLPPGWFMLHQYIYIVQQNTDDYGWQYRSTWSDGSLRATDEQWVDTYDDQKFVRRRLWMTTVVKRDDIILGKRLVTEEIQKATKDPILQEHLFFYQPKADSDGFEWYKQKVILYHDKLEFFDDNQRMGEANLADCEIIILTGEECAGKEYAFRIRHPTGEVDVILGTDARPVQLRWVKALKYQLAILTPDLNFEPFFYGPPTGELPENRVLLCGDLEACDGSSQVMAWETFQLILQERMLVLYYHDAIHGRLLLEKAIIKTRENENEFTLKLQSGLIIHFRAESVEIKLTWFKTLKKIIHLIELKKLSLGPVMDEEMNNLDVLKLYSDSEWFAQDVSSSYHEDERYLEGLRRSYDSDYYQVWSGVMSSPASPNSQHHPSRTMSMPPSQQGHGSDGHQILHAQSIANIVTHNGTNHAVVSKRDSGDYAEYNVYNRQPEERPTVAAVAQTVSAAPASTAAAAPAPITKTDSIRAVQKIQLQDLSKYADTEDDDDFGFGQPQKKPTVVTTAPAPEEAYRRVETVAATKITTTHVEPPKARSYVPDELDLDLEVDFADDEPEPVPPPVKAAAPPVKIEEEIPHVKTPGATELFNRSNNTTQSSVTKPAIVTTENVQVNLAQNHQNAVKEQHDNVIKQETTIVGNDEAELMKMLAQGNFFNDATTTSQHLQEQSSSSKAFSSKQVASTTMTSSSFISSISTTSTTRVVETKQIVTSSSSTVLNSSDVAASSIHYDPGRKSNDLFQGRSSYNILTDLQANDSTMENTEIIHGLQSLNMSQHPELIVDHDDDLEDNWRKSLSMNGDLNDLDDDYQSVTSRGSNASSRLSRRKSNNSMNGDDAGNTSGGESYVQTAKNLRHVDEEILNKTKDISEPINPLKLVQLRSVQNLKEPSPATPTASEESNILKQVKLRSVPSKFKLETGEFNELNHGKTDPTAGSTPGTTTPSHLRGVSDTEEKTKAEKEELKLGSIRERIQLFEKSNANNTPTNPNNPLLKRGASFRTPGGGRK